MLFHELRHNPVKTLLGMDRIPIHHVSGPKKWCHKYTSTESCGKGLKARRHLAWPSCSCLGLAHAHRIEHICQDAVGLSRYSDNISLVAYLSGSPLPFIGRAGAGPVPTLKLNVPPRADGRELSPPHCQVRPDHPGSLYKVFEVERPVCPLRYVGPMRPPNISSKLRMVSS